MTSRLPNPTRFLHEHSLVDWRALLDETIEAWFVAPTFADAISFVDEVARLADDQDHHPDIDVRYRRVHLRLTTHSAGGLTDRDALLAAAVSALATERGLEVAPIGLVAVDVAIDALDLAAVRPFWKAVLGYVDHPQERDSALPNALVDPLGVGPGVWFQPMDAPRPQRNRIHIDVGVPPEEAEARVAAAVAAGGVLVTDEHARAFWVLADPEGNEACVCTWLDRV